MMSGDLGMGRKILIVEDDVSLRRNVSYALVEDAYEVILAGTGSEALASIKAERVDLILLDVGLPDCCGFSLFHDIRDLTKAPVMFVTARSDDKDLIAGLEQGADDYIIKPFSIRVLQVKIRNVIRRVYSSDVISPSDQSTTIPLTPDSLPAVLQSIPSEKSGSPLKIDLQRQIITFFGSTIHTTASEFLLLATLASQPGKVFARRVLLDTIGVDPDGPYDRCIDGHVSNIRNKFRAIIPDPDLDPIVTHWSLGYSLRERWS